MKNLLISIGKKSKKSVSFQVNTKKKNKVLIDYYKLIKKKSKINYKRK